MKDKIRKVILVICVCIFAYSAIQLGMIFWDYHQIEKQSEELVSKYVEEPKVPEEKEEKADPLKRVIDFKGLQEANANVIGWLYIPDTKIDEPIVKGATNDSYLYTDIYKKNNKAGAVFIDQINSRDFSDDNTIIYGHNMKNGSRFHDLRYFVEKDYFNEKPYAYIYLPDGSINVYDIFSSAIIPATDDLYRKGVDYQAFVEEIINVSSMTREVSKEASPIIMLSTCLNGTDDRYVVFARLKENVKAE